METFQYIQSILSQGALPGLRTLWSFAKFHMSKIGLSKWLMYISSFIAYSQLYLHHIKLYAKRNHVNFPFAQFMAYRLINLGLYRDERSLPIAPVAPCEVVNLGVYSIGIYTPPNFTASQTCAMGEKENILNFTALISLVK